LHEKTNAEDYMEESEIRSLLSKLKGWRELSDLEIDNIIKKHVPG